MGEFWFDWTKGYYVRRLAVGDSDFDEDSGTQDQYGYNAKQEDGEDADDKEREDARLAARDAEKPGRAKYIQTDRNEGDAASRMPGRRRGLSEDGFVYEREDDDENDKEKDNSDEFNTDANTDKAEEIITDPNGVRLSNKVKDSDVNALNLAARRLKNEKLFPHDYHDDSKRQLQLSLLPTIHFKAKGGRIGEEIVFVLVSDTAASPNFWRALAVYLGNHKINAWGWRQVLDPILDVNPISTREVVITIRSFVGVGRRLPVAIVWNGALFATNYIVSFPDPRLDIDAVAALNMHQNSVLNLKIGNVPMYTGSTVDYAMNNPTMMSRFDTFVRAVARKSTKNMDRICDIPTVQAAPAMDQL